MHLVLGLCQHLLHHLVRNHLIQSLLRIESQLSELLSHHSQSYKVTVLIVTELQLSELLIHHSQSYSSHMYTSHRYTSHSHLVTALTSIEE